jgi:4-hydroxybenzoate polyprenyltransferase
LNVSYSEKAGVQTWVGLWRLLRFNDYAGSVVFTTLLGVAAAGGTFSWHLVLVLVANWVAVGFAFMYNDAEDAEDDARDEKKIKRNPVSAGLISRGQANIASFVAAGIGLALYVPLGLTTTLLGGLCIALGFLYSYRPWRLKGIAVADVVSHALMLSSLQLLCGYFAFADTLNTAYIAPLLSMTAASAYGQLFNQVRDFETDTAAGLRNTAALLGKARVQVLMQSLLTLAVAAGAWALLIQRIAPWWVFAFGLALLFVAVIPGVIRGVRSGNLQQAHSPVIYALPYVGTAMMGAWFLVPWLVPGMR